jgi:two-component system, NarL family, nitrate/nitrite response regulator NarL
MAPSILIVDDHELFRSLARELLEADGFAVVGEAADGKSAIAMVAVIRPDWVLVDVYLPDLSGWQLARRWSSEVDGPKVVLTSSRNASEFGRSLRDSGAIGFVAKDDLSGATLRALLDGAM